MIIGFTGTRNPLNSKQLEWIYRKLYVYRSSLEKEFHHGDCIGADEEAHKIAKELEYETFAHPANFPDSRGLRAYCDAYVVYPPLPPLIRDKVIVTVCDKLLAVPGQSYNNRSGTWTTIGYASDLHKPYEVCRRWDG